MISSLLGCVLAVFCATSSRASTLPRKISEDMARQLAAESLSLTKYLDSFEAGYPHPPFYVFALLGGKFSSAPSMWIGVNPWTGDVWNAWTCQRMSSRALRKHQAAIRQRFNPRDYARLHARKPECFGP